MAFRTSRKKRFYRCGPHGRTHLPNKAVFVCARFFLSRPLSNSKISERAPRSGNPATLPTHQVGSRHAGCATPAAFRHRKHAHERRARAPLCQLIRRSAVPACMKRSGAGLPLCTWSGCGGRLNGVVVATVKRGRGGDAPHCALSRCASINAERVACSQCCRVHWAPVYGVLHVAPVCGLLDVVRMSIGRVVECGRAKCA